MQAQCGGSFIDGAKVRGGHAQFVAANPEGDDGFGSALPCGFKNARGSFGPELPDRVKDPVDAQAAAGKPFGGAEDRFKISFRALLAEKHDADREGDLGIDDALREQLLAKVASDQRIVLGIAEKRGDPLESLQELHEALVGLTLTNFLFRSGNAVARGKRADRGRLDGTFKMKVQLCFGKREE